jgi:hypothetical protein
MDHPGGERALSPAGSLTVIPANERVKKTETAGFGKSPQRHFREGGNPFLITEQVVAWNSTCAGNDGQAQNSACHGFFTDLFARSNAGRMIRIVAKRLPE